MLTSKNAKLDPKSLRESIINEIESVYICFHGERKKRKKERIKTDCCTAAVDAVLLMNSSIQYFMCFM